MTALARSTRLAHHDDEDAGGHAADGNASHLWVFAFTSAWAANDDGTTASLGMSFSGSDTGTYALPVPRAPVFAPLARTFAGDVDAGAQTHTRLAAFTPDGHAYAGDLWLDVLCYRELRMRSFAAGATPGVEQRVLARYERALRAHDGQGGRQFVRFTCRQSVRIEPAGGACIDATMCDLSAGGAKLELAGGTRLVEGAAVALCVGSAGGPSTVLMDARVVWSRPGCCGIMFAGAPRRRG